MKDKLKIEEYFDDKELIKILIKKRVLAAKIGHDNHFFRNISSKAKSPHLLKEMVIFSFFPPRCQWIRLKKEEREALRENTLEINSIQLERTVWREIKKCQRLGLQYPLWLNKLLDKTEEIRKAVIDEGAYYNFAKSKIRPELKKGNTYRPISVFILKDSIIIGQIARYLSNCLDPLFSDSSYAFRTGIQKDKVFNHHKAVEDIIEFKNNVGKHLYVAECDIKKFFDCVNHKIIAEEFRSITEEAKQKLNVEIDQRAVHFFHLYLNAYSFYEDVKMKEKEILAANYISNGTIPWVSDSDLREVNSDPLTERIGVPQGGAISCLIANIMLNQTDRVLNAKADKNTFYCRFCDDMILMHTNKAKCKSLLKIYEKSLKKLKLISHKPQDFAEYGKAFWDEKVKSKLPYKWAAISHGSKAQSKKNVPWLSFVGYQVRYDGVVRVRKKSIITELKKQVSVTDMVIKAVRKAIRPNRSRKAIKLRLQQRLISMSVGRIRFGSTQSSMCWCAGFKVLKNNPFITNQIRRLDRNREKQIKRLERYLEKVKTPTRKSRVKPLKFFGHNYSYHKQFIK